MSKTKSKNKKVVITGGGTGGHVFPALAIADELKLRGFQISFVGTEKGMESRLVPEHGYPFFTVKTGAIKNQGLLKKLSTIFRLGLGFLWSLSFLIKTRPSAVIGVGGYVSVPVILAAASLRYPIFIQEQNVSVGLANRLLGRFANKVFLGFEQAEKHFPKNRSMLTGNPIRKQFKKENLQPYSAENRSILIMGGSQGARAINRAITAMLPQIKKQFGPIHILHQTGKADFEKTQEAYRDAQISNSTVTPFITDMADAYSQASLVICRAGALTVSELVETGRPAIFVPYPRRGQNDQVDNAKLMQTQGVAKMVEEGDGFEERLWQAITSTLEPEVLNNMAKNYSFLRTGDAVATIGDQIERSVTLGS